MNKEVHQKAERNRALCEKLKKALSDAKSYHDAEALYSKNLPTVGYDPAWDIVSFDKHVCRVVFPIPCSKIKTWLKECIEEYKKSITNLEKEFEDL
jgi:hypothetical protein